jgi:hypothetical protein
MHRHQLWKNRSVVVQATEANKASLRSCLDLLISSVPKAIVPSLHGVLQPSSEGSLCRVSERQRQRRPALRRGREAGQSYQLSVSSLSLFLYLSAAAQSSAKIPLCNKSRWRRQGGQHSGGTQKSVNPIDVLPPPNHRPLSVCSGTIQLGGPALS